MTCRRIVSKLKSEGLKLKFRKYYIIGLNALNRCEEEFFSYLKREGKAEFLWDYSQYYLNENINKAGYFIRQNLKTFPPPEDFYFDAGSFEEKKKIKVISAASNYGQAQEIPRFLEETDSRADNQFDSTAIILAEVIAVACPECYTSLCR